AMAEEGRSGKKPLGQPALVVRLAQRIRAVKHDGDPDRCRCQPVDVGPKPRDLAKLLAVSHNDEVPRLAVLRAAGPPGKVQQLIDDLLGDGLVGVLADLRDATDRPEPLQDPRAYPCAAVR